VFKVPLIKNAFVNEEQTRKELSEFISSGAQLSMGEKCKQFEEEFSKVQGRKYSVLFNSGGSANIALLQALKNLGRIKQCDNIGFSSLTWSTNVMPIIQVGCNPVPIDIEFYTLNISVGSLIQAILTKKIKVLFVTNALGFMPDYEKIKEICKENKIILLEDNCEALGSESNYCKSGNAGKASTFSFYIAHHLSTIEGGMVCTDDYVLANMLKIVRANGWDRNLGISEQKKLRSIYSKDEFYSKYIFYDLGYNLRPTEITGFLGLNQLQYLGDTIINREMSFRMINQMMKYSQSVIPIEENLKIASAFAIPLIFKNKKLKNKTLEKFNKLGIETRPMIAGNIQEQPFYKKYVSEKVNLEGCQFIHENSFYCGNYPEMTCKEIDIIIEGTK
jgi:CDP-6-deoxy-D-xylo-4-hexulose-3-dehydrase